MCDGGYDGDGYGDPDYYDLEFREQNPDIYGDDEYKKKWYFQKLCTYKKYIRICEYSITQGNDLRLDMIKLLEEEMRLACCDESDIVRTTSNLKKLSFETQGEEFVKKARDIVDSQIMDSKRVIIQNR